MTIKELVEILKDFPQDAQVKILYDGPDARTHEHIQSIEDHLERANYIVLSDANEEE